MKSPFRLSLALPAAILTLVMAVPPLQAKSDLEHVETSVGRLLEEGHYARQPLNDEVSKKFL